MMLMLCSIKIF